MIKQIFFLTDRFFNLYNFERLSKFEIELSVILTMEMLENSREHLQYFQGVFVVNSTLAGLTSKINLQEAEQVLLNTIHDRNNARIICNDDVNMQIAGILRDRLSIPGEGEEICLRFSDKLLSKTVLQKLEFKLPKFERFLFAEWLDNFDEYFKKLTNHYGLPFIIKPTNCASSLGFKIIKKSDDFQNLQLLESQDYEVEEFLKGQMLHCDTLIKNGKTLFSACSAYNKPMGQFLQGLPIASIILPEKNKITKILKKFSEIILQQLGYKNGAAHLEVFEHNSEITFLEVAMRCPGGLAIEAYKQAYDIDILENDFFIQADLEPNTLTSKSNYAFWMLYPRYEGRVIKRNEPKISCEYKIYWNCQEEQLLMNSKSLAETSASVMGFATTFFEANDCFRNLEKSNIIEMG